MLRKKKSAYEVLIFRDEQWMLEHLLDDEDQAKSAADRLMLQPTTAGVRITKKILRQDGGSVGVVVSEVMKTTMPLTQVRIADGIEAPFCESLEDYYELSSRLTIRRLLSDYLDQKTLLVSEVLHCADEADKLLAVIPLMKSAVTTAAASHGVPACSCSVTCADTGAASPPFTMAYNAADRPRVTAGNTCTAATVAASAAPNATPAATAATLREHRPRTVSTNHTPPCHTGTATTATCAQNSRYRATTMAKLGGA